MDTRTKYLLLFGIILCVIFISVLLEQNSYINQIYIKESNNNRPPGSVSGGRPPRVRDSIGMYGHTTDIPRRDVLADKIYVGVEAARFPPERTF